MGVCVGNVSRVNLLGGMARVVSRRLGMGVRGLGVRDGSNVFRKEVRLFIRSISSMGSVAAGLEGVSRVGAIAHVRGFRSRPGWPVPISPRVPLVYPWQLSTAHFWSIRSIIGVLGSNGPILCTC